MLTRAYIVVGGRVQRVFFRAFTRENALKLKINGWVRNLPDGGVEILCEGKEENIKELIEKLWKGPTFADVRDVKTEWRDYKGEFKNFTIKYRSL